VIQFKINITKLTQVESTNHDIQLEGMIGFECEEEKCGLIGAHNFGLSSFTEGVSPGRTTPMRPEPNHIRH